MMGNLLTAFSGAKRSDSNGRTVFDKIYGIKTNEAGIGIGVGENQTFAGADRPEFHKTLDGFEQVCVEREITNFIPSSRLKFESWNYFGDYSAIIEQGQSIPGVTNNGATKIKLQGTTQSAGRASESRSATGLDSEYSGESGCQCVIYNTGDNPVRVYGNRVGGTTQVNFGNIIYPGEIGVSKIYGTASDDGGKWMGFSLLNNTDAEFIAFQPQIEKSAYPSLFTEGTRLAPNSQITDGLVDSGTIAFKGNIVRDDSVNQDLFVTSGDALTDLSRLRLNTSNQFELQIFGSTGGTITQANPFTAWNNNERKDIEYAVSYDETNLYLFLSDGVNEYLYTTAHSINDNANKSFTFGSNSSIRLEIPLWKENVLRTTASEFNNIFS